MKRLINVWNCAYVSLSHRSRILEYLFGRERTLSEYEDEYEDEYEEVLIDANNE